MFEDLAYSWEDVQEAWVSDLHLGCRTVSLNALRHLIAWLERAPNLKAVRLNGDVVHHVWYLSPAGLARLAARGHLECLERLERLFQNGVRGYWLRGNHDRVPEGIMLWGAMTATVIKFTLPTGHVVKMTHGDGFDPMMWLEWLGNLGFELLLCIDLVLNAVCALFRWHPEICLSAYMKRQLKHVRKYLAAFRRAAVLDARREECDVAVVGHKHTKALRYYARTLFVDLGTFQGWECTATFVMRCGAIVQTAWGPDGYIPGKTKVIEASRLRPAYGREQWAELGAAGTGQVYEPTGVPAE